MTDDWTDNRKAAVANATNAQTNVNQMIEDHRERFDAGLIDPFLITQATTVMALSAQVFATLDLADATREQTRVLANLRTDLGMMQS